MAWNDPPSFDYQQISGSGRKFKHRYVSNDTKLGQQQSQFILQQHSQQTSLNNQQPPYLQQQAPQDHQQHHQAYQFNEAQPALLNNGTSTNNNYHVDQSQVNNVAFGVNHYTETQDKLMFPSPPPPSFPPQPQQ